MRVTRDMYAVLFTATAVAALVSSSARAQAPAFGDSTRTVELGFVQEWFHRELEPSIYSDTSWNISSVLMSYAVSSRVNLGLQAGLSEFEHDDFPRSDFTRWAVGGSLAFAALRRGAWDVGISARYLETFDFDTHQTSFHKRVRSFYASATLDRRFESWHVPVVIFAGPVYADDRIQTYAWDSRDPLESDSGSALGAQFGARFLPIKFISVFGYVNYFEQAQGGLGVALHAAGGGL